MAHEFLLDSWCSEAARSQEEIAPPAPRAIRGPTIRLLLAALLLVLGAACPSAAIDLTGVWVGTRDSSCQGYREGLKPTKSTLSPLEISILHDGASVIADGALPFLLSQGLVVADAKGVGHGLLETCVPVTYPNVFRVHSAKTFPEGSDGVSGRMVLELLSYNLNFDLYTTCKKIVLERTSEQTPILSTCP